jgi:DNA-binding MarR family transcriptional regulator
VVASSEEQGLMTRRRDPADRRRHIVELSEDGQDTLEAAHERLAAIEDTILEALSAEDRSTLHRLLLRAVGSDRSVRSDTATSPATPAECD